MPRLPYQTGIFLYRRGAGRRYEYAIFRRVVGDFWQCVSGGGEDGEQPLETAKREVYEETGLTSAANTFMRLQTTGAVPVTHFNAHVNWVPDRLVIPVHYFGMTADGATIQLSEEHQEFRWMPYDEAVTLLKWDGDKTALWELEQRLNGRESTPGPPPPL